MVVKTNVPFVLTAIFCTLFLLAFQVKSNPPGNQDPG